MFPVSPLLSRKTIFLFFQEKRKSGDNFFENNNPVKYPRKNWEDDFLSECQVLRKQIPQVGARDGTIFVGVRASKTFRSLKELVGGIYG